MADDTHSRFATVYFRRSYFKIIVAGHTTKHMRALVWHFQPRVVIFPCPTDYRASSVKCESVGCQWSELASCRQRVRVGVQRVGGFFHEHAVHDDVADHQDLDDARRRCRPLPSTGRDGHDAGRATVHERVDVLQPGTAHRQPPPPTNQSLDTIRDAILTCARKPTWVSLIYRTEPTTKKCKNRKLHTLMGRVCILKCVKFWKILKILLDLLGML